MKCLETDTTDTQYNLFADKISEECRDIVHTNPPVSPCDRIDQKPPTLDTFCKHNINIQYKYRSDGNEGTSKPCGICINLDKKEKSPSPCPLCAKKEMTSENKLAEAIKCISNPLPKWFNEQQRCDAMSVCCRTLGGIKKCPPKDQKCHESESSNIDKFVANYPPNKLTLRTELHYNPRCKPNFRCQGTVSEGDNHAFKPNYKDLPLTEKFYSKYERLQNIDTPEVRHYENELDRIINYFPRDVFCVPRYTNQYYGWLDSKKMQNLELCDASRVCIPKVLQNLKILENRRLEPIQLQYCLCHDMMKQMDHWKIV